MSACDQFGTKTAIPSEKNLRELISAHMSAGGNLELVAAACYSMWRKPSPCCQSNGYQSPTET